MSRRHLESYPTHPMSPPPNSSSGTKMLCVGRWLRSSCDAGDCTCWELTSDTGFSGEFPNADGSDTGNSFRKLDLFRSSGINTYDNTFYDMKSYWSQYPDASEERYWDVYGTVPVNETVQLTFRLPMYLNVWWAGGAFQQAYNYQHHVLPEFTVPFKTASGEYRNEYRTVTSPMQEYMLRGQTNGTVLRIRQQLALDLSACRIDPAEGPKGRIISRNIRMLYFGIAGKFDPT